jgi:putative phage-type endonuclease
MSMSAVLVPTANEAEWLAARRKGVTASEIAVIMGLSPYSSPYALYHQKLGILGSADDNAAMERGRALEPHIADKFGSLHPDLAALGDGRELYAHPARGWQMATPDRLVFPYHGPFQAPVAVLECKVDGGSSDWGEPGTDEIPVHYRCQALWQMDVMGVGTAHVACLRVQQWDLCEYVIELDDAARADLKLMRTEALDFLARLELGDVPDLDWRPATIAALKSMHPNEGTEDVGIRRSLVIQYQAAVRHAERAGRRKDEMTARMLAAIGDGRAAVDCRTGDVVATRSVSHPKKVSTKLLRERYPAIAAECTPGPKPVIRLLPARGSR